MAPVWHRGIDQYREVLKRCGPADLAAVDDDAPSVGPVRVEPAGTANVNEVVDPIEGLAEAELAAEAEKRLAKIAALEKADQQIAEYDEEFDDDPGHGTMVASKALLPIILCAGCMQNIPHRLCTEQNTKGAYCNAPLCSGCPKYLFRSSSFGYSFPQPAPSW